MTEVARDQAARAAVEEARDRAVRYLLAHQHSDGWWKGELETNVTMDAEDVMLRQFLGIRTDDDTQQTARWIRSKQHGDGSWGVFHGADGDLSTTIEAYVALRLAGDRTDADHMRAAREFVLEHGGVEESRVFTRIWLALFGEWPWDEVPAIPPEVVFLPSWTPLNVYDFACWARQTIVPLAIVSALRPTRPLGVDVQELRTGRPRRRPAPPWTLGGFLERADRALGWYGKRPVRTVRDHAVRRCAEWIVARQEADGSWGGIQPPWVYSLMALNLLGYPLDHPVLDAGLRGLDGFTVRERTPEGPVRRLEACQSPVWDTALAVIGLADAGVPADHPALVQAARWLLGEEIRVTGDWAVRRPGVAPSGWAFEFANDGYPDTDDTAEVVMALRKVSLPGAEADELAAACDRGLTWLGHMQSRDGGWGAFDVDNTRQLCAALPFCDFGEVIDPPSADVTAHIVEALTRDGRTDSSVLRRGVVYLLRNQEPDGSWFGRWGANHVYGTGAAVPALVEAGVRRDHLSVRRAVRWLGAHQNDDGGWGEDLRSYDDGSWVGRGASTASQTAWALLALVAAGRADGDVARRGAAWLAASQLPDGSWDEPWFTGTGFPGDFYIKYHLYRLVFPASALGRYLRSTS